MNKEKQIVENLIAKTDNDDIVWDSEHYNMGGIDYKVENTITGDIITFTHRYDFKDYMDINNTLLTGLSTDDYESLYESINNQDSRIKREDYKDALEIGLNW